MRAGIFSRRAKSRSCFFNTYEVRKITRDFNRFSLLISEKLKLTNYGLKTDLLAEY